MTTTPRPTDAELGILRVLWRRGPSTVRQVHEEMAGKSLTVYTTVLKLLQIMTEKGLVRRDDAARSHVYEPAVPETTTQRQLLDDLVSRAFGGSAKSLVMQALAGQKPTRQEIAELRRLLDSLEER